jgi:hypothetical protein
VNRYLSLQEPIELSQDSFGAADRHTVVAQIS